LQDFLIQKRDYKRLFKEDIAVIFSPIFKSILSAKQEKKLQHSRQYFSSKERGLMDGTERHFFIYKFQIRLQGI